MGKAARSAPALCLSAERAKLTGSRWTAEQPWARCGLSVQDRAWTEYGADFPPRATGKAVETAVTGAGCRTGAGRDTGADRGELAGSAVIIYIDTFPKMAYIANKLLEVLMGTRNVVLTDSQSTLIDELVASGRYQNASEALRAGLRLLEREEAELNDLRERLALGLAEARRGDLAEGSGEEAIRRAFASAHARN
jgi:antitoxin ParD1/3/4